LDPNREPGGIQPRSGTDRTEHKEIGNPAKADDILYNLREHERTAATTPWATKVWLTLQWALIGYGYAKALIWFALLVFAGVLMCDQATETTQMPINSKVWYSLARAPFLSLTWRPRRASNLRPTGWEAISTPNPRLRARHVPCRRSFRFHQMILLQPD